MGGFREGVARGGGRGGREAGLSVFAEPGEMGGGLGERGLVQRCGFESDGVRAGDEQLVREGG